MCLQKHRRPHAYTESHYRVFLFSPSEFLTLVKMRPPHEWSKAHSHLPHRRWSGPPIQRFFYSAQKSRGFSRYLRHVLFSFHIYKQCEPNHRTSLFNRILWRCPTASTGLIARRLEKFAGHKHNDTQAGCWVVPCWWRCEAKLLSKSTSCFFISSPVA